LAVDDRQRAMVAASDANALARLAHPNLRINAPGGRVLTREQFLANMRSGEIAAEAFERTAEDVSISGNVAVVMGRETFTPATSSELGRTFGAKPLQRRYTNTYVWQQGRWLWLARHANVSPSGGSQQLAVNNAPAHPANVHVGVPGRCEDKAENGGGAEGCFWSGSLPLGQVGPQLYWHIDRFPTVESANAARTALGAVTTALGGQVFLQTVNGDATWRPRGGERLSTVGPLIAPSGSELTARFMEATTAKASATFPHIHSGPEGFFLLEGAICVETPTGAHRADAGGSLVLPGGVPMQLSHAGQGVRRSLVLVIHPSTKAWIDRRPAWAPTGACGT
jgi:quercetin dioxygenase-like cupin family protein